MPTRSALVIGSLLLICAPSCSRPRGELVRASDETPPTVHSPPASERQDGTASLDTEPEHRIPRLTEESGATRVARPIRVIRQEDFPGLGSEPWMAVVIEFLPSDPPILEVPTAFEEATVEALVDGVGGALTLAQIDHGLLESKDLGHVRFVAVFRGAPPAGSRTLALRGRVPVAVGLHPTGHVYVLPRDPKGANFEVEGRTWTIERAVRRPDGQSVAFRSLLPPPERDVRIDFLSSDGRELACGPTRVTDGGYRSTTLYAHVHTDSDQALHAVRFTTFAATETRIVELELTVPLR